MKVLLYTDKKVRPPELVDGDAVRVTGVKVRLILDSLLFHLHVYND